MEVNNNNNNINSNEDRISMNLAFNRFKPICDELLSILSNSSSNNNNAISTQQTILTRLTTSLNSLNDRIKSSEPNQLTKLVDYINIPIVLLLTPDMLPTPPIQQCVARDTIQCLALQTVAQLAQRLTGHSYPTTRQFTEIVQLISSIIYRSTQPQQQQQSDNSTTTSKQQLYMISDEQLTWSLTALQALFQWWSPVSTSSPSDNLYSSIEQQPSPDSITLQSPLFISIGFTISTLLGILASNSITRNIKLSCLKTLSIVLYPLIQNKERVVVQHIFPGTLTSMFKTVTADYKVGTNVKVEALGIFTNLIIAVHGDNNSDGDNGVIEQFLAPEYSDSSSAIIQNNKQSPETSQAESNIHRFICSIFPNSGSHSNLLPTTTTAASKNRSSHHTPQSSVKISMHFCILDSTYRLLQHCSNTLPTIVPPLIETLVLYTLDDNEQLSSKSKDYLSRLMQHQSRVGGSIHETLQNNFKYLFQSLPRLICGGGESVQHQQSFDVEVKEMVTQLAVSYVKVIPESIIDHYITVRIDVISSTLLQLVEMHSPQPDQRIISGSQSSLEDTLRIVSDNPMERLKTTSKSKRVMQRNNMSRPYLHITSAKLEKWTFDLIRELGSRISLDNWINVLMSDSLTGSPRIKEILLTINQILIGVSLYTHRHNVDHSTITYILDEYLDNNLLSLPSTPPSYNDDTDPSSSLLKHSSKSSHVEQYLDNTIIKTLVVDGLAVICSFVQHRTRVIYPLLETLGSSSHDSTGLLGRSCSTTLTTLTTKFNYDSLEDIVYKNSDYLLDRVENNMRYLNENPNTPNVFKGILSITGLGFLPFLKDTVEMILMALDTATEQSKSITIFIKILYNIIKVLYNNSRLEIKYNSQALQQQGINTPAASTAAVCGSGPFDESSSPVEPNASIDNIKSFFIGHHKQKEINEQTHNYGGQHMQQQQHQKQQSMVNGDSKFLVTTEKQRELLSDIIHKCKHFIGSSNREIKMTVLEIVEMGLWIVSTGNRKYGGDEEEEEKTDESIQPSSKVQSATNE
ncbi:hypothetical protein SAMD00019534_014630 [Acytostelium subglobosum LB1]|uniref:hypothetical protein n=1 Tax=Acytostelium subglobosum LB1 TaxID=1410327 RepID=UPI00064503C0|nr:hypothetical protein SAMD00019534_014630 [Acytostelium subglobosum LB1]GAM18288.1 hypothetical protein SAMD00019534_014630 [Acytostelium subglobosum LB1]|eukprot:XP_012758884.1 hypothetical protein SAMD00019534_014630 [Acytostelium subglobosum LB1]